MNTELALNQCTKGFWTSPGTVPCLTSFLEAFSAFVRGRGSINVVCVCSPILCILYEQRCVIQHSRLAGPSYCVCVCVWIRTKADELAPCFCPSWLPPQSGLVNNRRRTNTHTIGLDTIACVHSRPLVLAHSNRGQQSMPAVIRLNVVGGVDRKIKGLFSRA